jgi:dihydrofolate reductase
VAEATGLRAKIDGNILVAGSSSLVHALHDAGLIDEYRLMIYPTVLGSGKRLFRDGASPAGYEAVDVRPTGAVALMTLRPLADGGDAAA